MLLFLTVLACGEKVTDTAEVQETAAEPTDTAGETETPPEPFSPNAGHWTYSGGELIEAGTTCQLDSATEGELTEQVGFTLSTNETGFTVLADGALDGDTGSACVLTDPESLEAGGYICQNASVEQWFEKVYEDDFGNDMDVKMTIDTAVTGVFSDASSLINTFTLTLTCTEVDYFLPLSCSDINSQFPTPCTIQFTAEATLDQ
jgi:hypothetical protein